MANNKQLSDCISIDTHGELVYNIPNHGDVVINSIIEAPIGIDNEQVALFFYNT